MTEDRNQKSEIRSQKSEGRRQKARNYGARSVPFLISVFCLLTSAACVANRVSDKTAEDRSFGRSLDDSGIKANILGLYAKSETKGIFSKITVRVYEARVYLFGQVNAQATADEAQRLAWLSKGVREVINNVQVGGADTNFGDDLRDTRIRTQIETRWLATRGITSANYIVEVFYGTAYLIGTAKNQAELDAVTQIVRTTSGVTQVKNYLRLQGDPNNYNGR